MPAQPASGQPAPNLLFAAVHLLLSGEPVKGDPLARYYSSLTEPTTPSSGAFPAFRRFCLAHAGAIAEIISSRSVNTNEVGRRAVLRLGYAENGASGLRGSIMRSPLRKQRGIA